MKMDSRDFFKEVTRRICSSLDIEEALSATYTYFQGVIPVDAIGLMYKDLARGVIYPIAQVEGKGVQFFDDRAAREVTLPEEYIRYVKEHPAMESGVVVANRPDKLPAEILRCFPKLKSFSTIKLSLNIHKHNIGDLVIAAKGTNRYSDDDVKLIESVLDPITIAMSNARRYQELIKAKNTLDAENKALSEDIQRQINTDVVGAEFGLREVMNLVHQVAPSNSPTLLLGETGTGKEVIANAIHMASPRRHGPIITMQCGAVQDTLFDNELFGHEKGAYTGAYGEKRGRFERAHGGTLFLDEVGELSGEAQVKLLRVLQEKQFERLGGSSTISVDVRIIAATHRDLEGMVRAGKFREDLWYRLNVIPIHIPPLRVRREDIPSLVRYFVERKAKELNRDNIPLLDNLTIEQLQGYSWPGNIRELQNVVERSLLLSKGTYLHFPDLNAHTSHSTSANCNNSYQSKNVISMEAAMTNHIRFALSKTNGKIAGKGGAADLLQINPSTLRSRIKKLGIQGSVPKF